jgi:hypothetical protein
MALATELFNKKRALIVCAFFVISCTPAQVPDNQTVEDKSVDSQAAQKQITQEVAPLLSLQELLNADDVKNALAIAAEQDDKEALRYWQTALLEAADEVRLTESERKLIQGEQGIAFLDFQGMKTNYQNEFEEAFFNFGDIDAVYAKYPAFENAQANSKALVEKRDELIQKVVNELEQQGYEGDALEEARRQWRNYAFANMPSAVQTN